MARLKSGFRRRKNGSLELRFSFGNKQYSVYGFTAEECEKRKQSLLESLESKNIYDIDGHFRADITVANYFEEWILERKNTVAKSTIYTDTTRYKCIDPTLGRLPVKSISLRHVKSLQAQLYETHNSDGVNGIMITLIKLLNGAVDDGIIKENPCDRLKRLKRVEPKASETNHRALTREEQKLFFQYAKSSYFYEPMAFMVLTGCRVGEVGALTWDNIDYLNGFIHIRHNLSRTSNKTYEIGPPKTQCSKRDIPLTDPIKEILELRKKKAKTTGTKDLVFKTLGNDYVLRGCINNAIDSILAEISKKEEIEIAHFSSHAFRDTFATRAIEQGMQPNTLKQILGHSSIKTTMDLYAHVLPGTKQEEMEKLNIAV